MFNGRREQLRLGDRSQTRKKEKKEKAGVVLNDRNVAIRSAAQAVP